METPRPSTKHGNPVFGGGWEEFSEPDAYALHPAMLAVLGGLGDVFAAAYRNQPFNVKLNDQQASASKSMARSIQNNLSSRASQLRRSPMVGSTRTTKRFLGTSRMQLFRS